MRIRILLPTLLLGLAPLFVGCGSDEEAADVASAGGDASSDTGGEDAGLTGHDQVLAYAQCLRENGLDVDDPAPGENVQLMLTPETKDLIKQAQEACQQYAPQGGPGAQPGGLNPETMQEFAECMRQNGVEAFPDPDPNQPGMLIGGDVAEDPDLSAAQEACSDILGGGVQFGGGQ